MNGNLNPSWLWVVNSPIALAVADMRFASPLLQMPFDI